MTTNAGDNNGFEVSAMNACADDGSAAADMDSGTGPPHSCASVTKDRHLFWGYGFAIPPSATVNDIEVRLDAWADGATSAPFLCVELSWDGGASWTVDKTTPTLGTSEAAFILGGVGDSWGRQWTAAELGDANFRVRVTTRSPSASRDFYLDWVAVQVNYSTP